MAPPHTAAAAPRTPVAEQPSLGEAAEYVHISTIVPWPRNPRKNDGEPVDKVAASIKKFGFAAPIVARLETREIIAGHTRWKAARQLGLEYVPVRFMDITEDQAHLLALADNRLGEIAEWDTEELRAVLEGYSTEDIAVAGWDDLGEVLPMLGPGDGPPSSDEEAGAASFGLFNVAQITEALVGVLHGRTQGEFAPALPDVMVALNRCAAGKGAALSRVTDRWFPHRYDVRAGSATVTPNQQLQDQERIRAAARMTMGVMKQWGTSRELQNNILLSSGQCARQFPIDRARAIYLEFTRDGARVLDPCAGWGGRLLGWVCAARGGEYCGYDAGAATAASHRAMISELGIANAVVHHAAFEDVQLAAEAFDFAFTSPPYFTLERYGSDAQQAEVRYPEYAAWRTGFLEPLIVHTLDALKPGGVFVLNLSEAAGATLTKDALEIARKYGARVERRRIDIGGYYKVGGRDKSEYEDLFVLRKPEAT